MSLGSSGREWVCSARWLALELAPSYPRSPPCHHMHCAAFHYHTNTNTNTNTTRTKYKCKYSAALCHHSTAPHHPLAVKSVKKCPKQNQNCGTRTRPPSNYRGYKLERSKLSHHNVQWGWKGDVREWLAGWVSGHCEGSGHRRQSRLSPLRHCPTPGPPAIPYLNLCPTLIYTHH